MSQFAPDLPPSQQFRSPLGTAPGTPGPLAAPAPDAPPDLGALPPPDGMPPDPNAPPDAGGLPPGLQMLPPPPGPGDEIPMLKAMIVHARDYSDIPTVDESERLQMEQVTTILQKLLADNQRMADQATGSSPQNRKLLGGV